MQTKSGCPARGAPWTDERTCQDDFYQMLFWEAEVPARGDLMVLCFSLREHL